MNRQSKYIQQIENPRPGIRGYWLIGAILFGLAIAVSPFDRVSAQPVNFEHLPGDLKRLVKLTELFAHGFGIGVVTIGIWLLAAPKRRFIPRIVTCAVWPSLAVHLIKLLFGRYRPAKFLDERSVAHYPANMSETWLGWLPNDQVNVDYATQSFPSAHAAAAWGLAIGMSWVFPKGRYLFFSIAILASIQRVTAFAHWPSDVFCGAAIAFVMGGAITHNWGLGYFLGRLETRHSGPQELSPNSDDDLSIRKAA